MGLVLWIDQNEIATGLFEKIFKERGKQFYTLASVSDFSYLIRDLNPSIIVIDGETALKDLGRLKIQYEETQGFMGRPVVFLGPVSQLDFIQNVKGTLERPINPFQLPDLLSKFAI